MIPSLDMNKAENLSIKRLLDRGTAEILEKSDTGIFVRDTLSGAHMISDNDVDEGRRWLLKYSGMEWEMIVIFTSALMDIGVELFRPDGISRCYQYGYYEDAIDIPRRCLSVRASVLDDLPWISSIYRLVSPEELRWAVGQGKVIIGSIGDRDVGFIGEHSDGSMGLLNILPEFRHRGYAEELERIMIDDTLRRGLVPFCQVELDNSASMQLQEKLGLVRSDDIMCWIWKE